MDSASDNPSAERWAQIQRLFDSLVELPVEERARQLDEVCLEDPELHGKIESLLAAHDRADEVLHDLEHPELAADPPGNHDDQEAGDSHRLIGRRINHYGVLELLGGGGMGVVYRAEDERLGRTVALKFLPPIHSLDPTAKERFTQEARAASALDHPNICSIHEIAESENGRLFIAMAYYEGESLKEKIASAPLPIDEVLGLALQIAEGLAAVHRHGIIHRDIKPANLVVTEDGVIKILDFGLAKVADVTLTQTGRTMGTVAYMSPEQVRGDEIDARTDLWSLGVVLYELITGQRPFRGEHEQSVIYSILNEEPEPPGTLRADTPDAVGRVVLKLLRKEPGARYRGAEALLADLEAIREGKQPPTLTSERRLRYTSIKRRWAAMAACALLLLAGTIWGAMRLGPQIPPLPDPVKRSTIGVLPFSVSGDPDLAYLSQGLVDVLSLKLEATGSLNTITPGALMSHIEERYPGGRDSEEVDPDLLGVKQALEIADHFVADYVIIGEAASAHDGIRLTASLYNSHLTRPVGVAEAMSADEAGLIGAIDELVGELIDRVTGTTNLRIPSISTLATSSMPALRSYLEGLSAERRLKTNESDQLMRRALAADSTFALPYFHMAMHRGHFGGEAELKRALLLGGDLPPRQRMHMEAYKTFIEGKAPEAEKLYRRIVASYADDIDAWYYLGQVLVRYNAFYGRPIDEAREVFQRVVALDRKQLQATLWLMIIAAVEREIEAFDSLSLLTAERLMPDRANWHAYRLLPTLTGASPAERASALAELDAIGSEDVNTTLSIFARYWADLPTLRWLSERKIGPANPAAKQAQGYRELALLDAAQGRFSAATANLDALTALDPGWGIVLHASLATVPLAPSAVAELMSLRTRVAAWDTTSAPLTGDTHIGGWADLTAYLQGLLSFRLNDDAATRSFAKQLKQRGASEGRGIPAAQMASRLEALSAWKRGEAKQALANLEEARVDLPLHLRDSPLHTQTLDRYVRAEVLYGAGRYEEALPWVESLSPAVNDDLIWPYMAPAQLRIAEIHERLANVGEAADHYRRFLELWRDCDPELRPIVERAALRLEDLTTSAPVSAN